MMNESFAMVLRMIVLLWTALFLNKLFHQYNDVTRSTDDIDSYSYDNT